MHMYHIVVFQKQWLFMYTISISIDQGREQLICITKMTSSMLKLSSYFTLWSIKKMVHMPFYNKTQFIPPRLPLPLLSVRNGKFLWQKRGQKRLSLNRESTLLIIHGRKMNDMLLLKKKTYLTNPATISSSK